MKYLILIFLSVPYYLNARTNKSSAFCSLWYGNEVKKIAENHGDFDKFKHCAVSCLLTLRCPWIDVAQAGILKEFADILGAGNPEIGDLKANRDGIMLVLNGNSKTDDECIHQCQELHHQ